MKRFARIVLLLLLPLLSFSAIAQELKCRVSINTSQLQSNNRRLFGLLENEISRFMNGRSLTGQNYSVEERIECSLFLTLSGESGNDFRGMLQIQVERPVFGATYKTLLLNYIDQLVEFSYIESETLEYNETAFTSNLSSLLAYYAYLIIGLDADTFAPQGGTPWYTKAEAIVANAQNAREKGWKAFDGSGNRNRYALIQNLLDSKYRGVRAFLYDYHRLGLDKLSQSVTDGRAKALESVMLLKDVHASRPDSYMVWIQLLCDAKADEWIALFSKLSEMEKQTTALMLKQMNPSNITKYDRLTKP